MLWIRLGFNMDPDPDPAFYLNVDPDTDSDPGRRTNADLDQDPVQTFESHKVEFYMNNLKVCNRSKAYLRRYESLFDWQKAKFIFKVWSISMLQDPDPHSQYGSGSVTAKECRSR